MAKPANTGKPTTLPGRRVGQHRKDGTTAPAAGRQNMLAPGASRRPSTVAGATAPIAGTTSPTTGSTAAAAAAAKLKTNKGRAKKSS